MKSVLIIFWFVVTPAYQEPLPGWVDSLNGPIGIMVAGGKGVIRSMLCEAEFGAEVIPVDHAINGLIGIAYTVATMKQKWEEFFQLFAIKFPFFL